MNERKNTYPFLEKAAIVIVIFVFTFPDIDPEFGIGLDHSYKWALNYLFDENYSALTELVYPFGPLGFLKKTTAENLNLLYAIIFYCFVKIGFVFLFLNSAFKANPERKILSALVVAVVSLIINIDFLIIGTCILLCLVYIEEKSWLSLTLSIALAFIGFCIKSSIGIAAFSAVFMSACVNFYLNRNYLNTLKIISLTTVVVLFLGLIIFRDFELIYTYFVNAFHLSNGYSEALALHPENNWYVLCAFILSVFIVPVLCKERISRITFLLFIPSLFVLWKHSMSREDLSHNSLLYYFLFLFWGVLIVFTKNHLKTLLITSCLNIFLFYFNFSGLPGYKATGIDYYGVVHFKECLMNYKEFQEKFIALCEENIRGNKLDSSVVKTIGRKSIDTYPWELSYIPANNFNWQPRPTLQSGAYSQWLDSLNAQAFEREIGPEFILFHFVKDQYGGDFGSIDGRYLLNDNPKTIVNILNHYSLKTKTENYLLFYKNTTDNLVKTTNEKKQESSWNTWIDVPFATNELIRLKVFSEVSLTGKMKNFLYKSELYFVDYLMENDSVLSFRYIPENGRDGIWINPFIQIPASNIPEQKVAKVKLRCTNPLFNDDAIFYQIERISVDNDKSINDLFVF